MTDFEKAMKEAHDFADDALKKSEYDRIFRVYLFYGIAMAASIILFVIGLYV